jgi:hypothetical protein
VYDVSLPIHMDEFLAMGTIIVDSSDTIGTRCAIWCPYCREKRYISKWHIGKTTFCRRHQGFSKVKWVEPDKFSDRPNVVVDYNNQKLDWSTSSKRGPTVFIWSKCPDCPKERWLRSNIISRSLSTRCLSCASSGSLSSTWNGGIRKSMDGYLLIHAELIRDRYGDEFLRLVRKNLYGQGDSYLQHRVVALHKYGPAAVVPGIVVRHIDGDKTNNSPDNLVLGTKKDNVQDHVTDRRDAKMWRSVALSLFRMLSRGTT